MGLPTITSTFLLTLLMMVGLFFFIRASVKDRTEQIKILTSESEDSLLPKIQAYFEGRSYRAIDINAVKNQVTFEGFVRPSLFLAIFLSILAALGFISLGFVIVQLYPFLGFYPFFLFIFAPLAGWFYWQKSGRLEKVLLSIQPSKDKKDYNFITVIGHRDELFQIQKNLPVERGE